MIVFTRKHPVQRMLKKRTFKKSKQPILRFGTIGIYCLYTFRFEYRYCLFLRKFFKKLVKRKKRKIRTHFRRRTWLFIRPNYTLTHKSKNARMGKGKGNFKRWVTVVYPGRVFIEHLNISIRVYKKYVLKMQIKMKLFLHIISITNNIQKHKLLTNIYTSNDGSVDIIRIRKQINH